MRQKSAKNWRSARSAETGMVANIYPIFFLRYLLENEYHQGLASGVLQTSYYSKDGKVGMIPQKWPTCRPPN